MKEDIQNVLPGEETGHLLTFHLVLDQHFWIEKKMFSVIVSKVMPLALRLWMRNELFSVLVD